MNAILTAVSCIALAVLSFPAVAGEATFGKWVASTMDDGSGVFAATFNDSGDIFGEWCNYKAGTCTWKIAMHTQCKANHVSIVLANSDSVAMGLDVICQGQLPGSTLARYAFKSWEALESSLKDASRIGFAVPLESDQFTVVRFSLAGRSDAQQAAESLFFGNLKKHPPSTVDQTL